MGLNKLLDFLFGFVILYDAGSQKRTKVLEL